MKSIEESIINKRSIFSHPFFHHTTLLLLSFLPPHNFLIFGMENRVCLLLKNLTKKDKLIVGAILFFLLSLILFKLWFHVQKSLKISIALFSLLFFAIGVVRFLRYDVCKRKDKLLRKRGRKVE